MDGDQASGFLARWARRKQQVRSGVQPPELEQPPRVEPAPVAPPPVVVLVEPAAGPPAVEPTPLPTLQDVAALTRESDYARFVTPGVSSDVRNAAVKKLFTDPHYNLMDGLDTYIDDYGKPDPLPLSMLRQLNQSKFLGLFDHEDKAPAATEPDGPDSNGATEPTEPTPDDHADLQLQQDDAAGRPGAGPGADG
ncbi:MAG: DUF3306 domain-containing protein [Burkholderiaceae bacterium]